MQKPTRQNSRSARRTLFALPDLEDSGGMLLRNVVAVSKKQCPNIRNFKKNLLEFKAIYIEILISSVEAGCCKQINNDKLIPYP